LTEHISNSKAKSPDEFGEMITNEYHDAVSTATNQFGATPLVINKPILKERLINGFMLVLVLLTLPTLSIPIISMPGLPTLPRLATIPIPILPGISIPSFNIGIPNIPIPTLPSLPAIPGFGIPSLPVLPVIQIPNILNIFSIPNITLPMLPRIPNIMFPGIPSLPQINIPDLSINSAKAKLIFSLSLSVGLFQYWNNAKLALLPPPGAVSPLDNVVTIQNIPSETIPIKMDDSSELPRKIAKTAREHLQTIGGITTGVTSAGATVSVP